MLDIQPAPTKLCMLTATEILHLIKSDLITVEQYAQALLDRVKSRDRVVKAWQYYGMLDLPKSTQNLNHVSPDPELVLNQARILDQVPRDQRGPLHGVAIGIKDNMDTKGKTKPTLRCNPSRSPAQDMPTQYASPLYKSNKPNADASPVAILRRSGALIFGTSIFIAITTRNRTEQYHRQNNHHRIHHHELRPIHNQPPRPDPHTKRILSRVCSYSVRFPGPDQLWNADGRQRDTPGGVYGHVRYEI
jgi:hypothetical protein